MKQLNFLLLILGLAAGQTATAQTLHAVLAADTGNAMPEFAAMCQADFDKMKKEVAEMATGAGYHLEIHTVAGEHFTSKNLQETLAALSPAPADACLLYFSGAGFCDAAGPAPDRERTLRMGVNGQDLAHTAALVQTLEAKGARLNVVIVDACSKLRNLPVTSSDRGGAEHEVYKSLLSACGTFRGFSSRCGEYSYGDADGGSIYTNALLWTLDHFISIGSQHLTWETLLEYAGNTTAAEMNKLFLLQHPVFYH